MTKLQPNRGEVWTITLDPTMGHEQAGFRPCLIFSHDDFNHGPADLVVVLPITSKDRKIPLHISIPSSEGGLNKKSFIMCENIRAVTKERLRKKLGRLEPSTLLNVEDSIKILLSL